MATLSQVKNSATKRLMKTDAPPAWAVMIAFCVATPCKPSQQAFNGDGQENCWGPKKSHVGWARVTKRKPWRVTGGSTFSASAWACVQQFIKRYGLASSTTITNAHQHKWTALFQSSRKKILLTVFRDRHHLHRWPGEHWLSGASCVVQAPT